MMSDSQPLAGQRDLFFVDDIYEDLELWYPKLRLIEAGAAVVVAGPKANQNYSGKHGYPCRSDAAIAEVREPDFTGLVIPGGFAPDKLRRDPAVLNLVKAFHAVEKAFGGNLPRRLDPDLGRRLSRRAGDRLARASRTIWSTPGPSGWMLPVVVDRHFISSRKPDDLPDFCRGIIETALGKSR